MANEYISSMSNRIYIKSETDFPELNNMAAAEVAPITSFALSSNRKQLYRRDKTGFRSESPVMGPQRELIEFNLESYGTGWSGGNTKPGIAPILESGMCASAQLGAAYLVQANSGSSVTLQADAPLTIGMGLSFGSEIRFVESISGPRDFTLNTPFSIQLSSGAQLDGCANLSTGDSVNAMSVLDTWAPSQAIQRFLTGAVADQMKITVNNDFLEIGAKGFARNLFDNVSGVGGVGFQFPEAPANASPLANSPIAGHLGQAFIGVPASRLCTLTQAEIRIDNNIEPRTDEFGCFDTKAFVLGRRKVSLDLTVFERNDALSQALYTKAVNNEPVPVMLQMGTQSGSMFAVYLPSVLFPVPAFNDDQPRLLWQFRNAVAMGLQNDEIFIAMR
ncbi:MAG: hypothetical protein FJW36_01365 [Acidobacteria bacterium]|nr:hypothetical protein [Acidobacteriota bacterium]